jgi:AraC-like DNA-binding protein
VRLSGADHYLILFQVAGQSTLTQIDQTMQLTAGDVALVSCSTDKLFERICGVIKDGLSDPDFGPHEVAVAARVSLRYVQKLFTERGTTCSEFIYSLRLGHAAHLLQRRALLRAGKPLSEIAYACGFRDYAHFARRFRNRFGCPPGAYAGYDQSADHGTVRAGTGESASSTHDVQARAS